MLWCLISIRLSYPYNENPYTDTTASFIPWTAGNIWGCSQHCVLVAWCYPTRPSVSLTKYSLWYTIFTQKCYMYGSICFQICAIWCKFYFLFSSFCCLVARNLCQLSSWPCGTPKIAYNRVVIYRSLLIFWLDNRKYWFIRWLNLWFIDNISSAW